MRLVPGEPKLGAGLIHSRGVFMTGNSRQLLDLLKIAYPIIQAPMAGGITTPGLVAAVSAAGGLGSFGAAYMSPEELRAAIRVVRAETEKTYQVNLFVPDAKGARDAGTHERAMEKLRRIYADYGVAFAPEELKPRDYYAAHVEVVLAEKTPVVSFVFGVPGEDVVRRLKEAGCVLIGTATCVAEGLALAKAGMDAIAVQGFEAGGHRGTFHSTLREAKGIPNIGLFALLAQMVETVDVPVIASGGIMNGAGIAAALALGAAAAQMGTAFMGCPEAGVTESWRRALRESADVDTALTKVFSGRMARGIGNEFMQEMAGVEEDVPDFPWQNALTGPLRREAKKRDDAGHQSLWAGQAARLVRFLPAAELVRVLVAEMGAAG